MPPLPVQEESIFYAALQLAGDDARGAYLASACQGDAGLRQRVERLIAAHGVGEFLERPGGDLDATALLPAVCEQPGAPIGPYKLLEQIGEGGMGLVFMAEQTRPLRRRVALKIIKPGLDTQAVIARFEAERQALALMDHPNIARVYDAGATESGRPYFVMELVRGVPITEYCSQHELDIRGRLKLFMEVCQAVQHAHQKGIIHRDLKPTNILVAHDDTTPVPKVIDFGVAKATSQQLTDRTLFTHFAQFIGTPLYMSPEQAELNYRDVDTRSDVYSLGVVLYELLTGTTPFDADRLRSVGPDEMRRIIRDEEPPKPSTRATTAAGALSTVSAKPGAPSRRDASALKGDLDWIVMKALEKDRRRRYESASALADDVRRHLDDEAILAAAPSALYRARKFVRRHRGRVALGAALAAVCVVGVISLGYSTLAISESLEQTQAAEREASQDRNRFRSERDRAETALYVADVRLAHEEWKHARLAETARLLNSHLPRAGERDLRGWEWHYLAELVRGSSTVLGDKTTKFLDVAWSPDGRRLATADEDCQIKIWDAVALRELRTLRGHAEFISSVEWSPDGRRLASADADGGVHVWDVEAGTSFKFDAFDDVVRCVAWSPDGKQLAAGGDDEILKVWDVDSRQELVQLPGHDDMVWDVAWSPDGRRLASVDNFQHRTIRVWDIESGKLISSKSDAHDSTMVSVSWSPDGKRLATGATDTRVKIWEIDNWESRTLTGHVGNVLSVQWSPDGAQLASASSDGSIIVWNEQRGAATCTLKGHEDTVRRVCWRPDGRRLASASWDGTVRLWDPTCKQDFSHLQAQAYSYAAWSPDGRQLAASLDAPDPGVEPLQIFDAASGDPVGAPIKFVSDDGSWIDPLPEITWSLNGKLLAFAYTTQHKIGVKIVDVAKRTESATFYQPAESLNHEIRSIAFNPDASLIAAAVMGEPMVIVWDTITGDVIAKLPSPSNFPGSVAWSPDGRRLAATTFDGIVKIWNTATWQQVMELDCHPQDFRTGAGGPHLVSWSSDGSKLAAGSVAGGVIIWNPATGREILSFSAHSGQVKAVAFSPDGGRLATGGQDRAVKIWDAASGAHLLTLGNHDLPVGDVAWSPDGSRLLTTGEFGHLIWTAPGAANSHGK